MRNSLEPESMTPAQRLEEVAGLLATGFLRLRLRAADKRKKVLDVLRVSSDECVEWLGGLCPPPWQQRPSHPSRKGERRE